MKVGELIEQLSKSPLDAEVYGLAACCNDPHPVVGVEHRDDERHQGKTAVVIDVRE